MISVSTDMILTAVATSLLLGIFFAIIYSVLPALFSLFFAIALRLFRVRKKRRETSYRNGIFDFFFTLVGGIAYILLLYAYTDGVFFLCTLAALFLGFFGVRKILHAIRTCFGQIKRKKKDILR